jgi:hypothetical protein
MASTFSLHGLSFLNIKTNVSVHNSTNLTGFDQNLHCTNCRTFSLAMKGVGWKCYFTYQNKYIYKYTRIVTLWLYVLTSLFLLS